MSKFVSKLVSFEVATPPIVRERLEELVPVGLAREMLRHAGNSLRAHPCVILALEHIVVLRRMRVWVRVRVVLYVPYSFPVEQFFTFSSIL